MRGVSGPRPATASPTTGHGGAGGVLLVVADQADVLRLAPVAAALGDHAELVHVGAAWDAPTVERFLTEVGCPRPGWFVALGQRRPAERFTEVRRVLRDLFARRRPGALVVHGRSPGSLGAAYAASGAGVPVVRLAPPRGPRRPDRDDRAARTVDHLADLCVVADDRELMVLLADGVAPERLLRSPAPVGDGLAACARARRAAAEPSPATATAAPVVAVLDAPELARHHAFVLELLRCLGRLDGPAVIVPGREAAEALELAPTASPHLRVAPELDLVDRTGLFARARAAVCDSPADLEALLALGRPVVAAGPAAPGARPRHVGCRPAPEPHDLEAALDEVLDAPAAPPADPADLPLGGARTVAEAALDLAEHRPLVPLA